MHKTVRAVWVDGTEPYFCIAQDGKARLTLGVSGSLAGSLEAGFLALFDACIPS